MYTRRTRILPSHWACALINNDWSGMDDDEAALKAYLAECPADGAPVDCEDAGFRRHHDAAAYVRDCDCEEFVYLEQQ